MARRGGASWFTNLQNAYAIHNVLAQRPELALFVIRRDGVRLDWMDLSDPSQRLKPFHFEIFFGKEADRDRHYLDALTEASRAGRVVVRELHGFSDLFYQLPTGAEPPAFLFAGQFYTRQPDWAGLCAQWRGVAGREPVSGDPDFVHFVRMALALPVIENELLDALVELIGLYGDYLTDNGDGDDIHRRIDDINRDRFAPLWPIEEWVQSAISPDKFHLTPWSLEGGLTGWMKEGLGITRLPTTAMALMPVDDRDQPLDPVQALVRNARLQRAVIAHARALPETAATRLQDYGVSIITSARPGKGRGGPRVELRERARRLQAFAEKTFGVPMVVGIGPTLPAGAPLHPSHREAVLALHMCVQLDKRVLFHDEHGEREPGGYAAVHAAAAGLIDALARENPTEVKAASDRFVQLVLRHSDERIEVARGQFLATLFQLLAAVARRNPMPHEARDAFTTELAGALEQAHSVSGLIDAFKTALARLNLVSARAWHGSAVMRLEATLRHLRDNFAEPLPLNDVARRAGFSVPAFTRAFRQATGTSFLAHLRALRVDHAKRLLQTTPMTLEVIAQASGFRSQHHLIRSFKKVTGRTPGHFRKPARKQR